MYQQSAPAASTTSLALSSQGDETENNNKNLLDEFDHDENVETVKEARKVKDLSKTWNVGVTAGKNMKVDKVCGLQSINRKLTPHCQKTVTIKLELANVTETDGKEREKTKS